ncbi:glycogen synthase GlgA [Geminisphaera colitermitum]|uniref:glycogen synthase GlgA n=1 Tax=Geminisphaera colitermitum TaxID=1148786 RepID=UPI0006940BB1|nr:glycogen synthase GlgA [Geminisphaera colitermitum]
MPTTQTSSLKILFVSPEVEPFVKVGGLADMVGALPKALAALGHDVRIVCPAYGCVKIGGPGWRPRQDPLGVDVGDQAEWARTWETTLPRATTPVPVYFLEHHRFFGRPEVYTGPWGAHEDNDLRFAFFSRAALTLCLQLGWTPDVVHCHDWTTGFVPVYLNTVFQNTALRGTASVFTIHNLEHQGTFSRRALDYARLPASEFRPDSVEALGGVNMMKAGLYHATKLTTVSPTYAHEIRTPEGGCGLHDVLTFRGADLMGILNGIDTSTWSPEIDMSLPSTYSAANFNGKAVCKAALQREFGLKVDPGMAVFGIVSRFAHQKGLDLVAEALPHIVKRMHVQFVILGAGDPGLEYAFRGIAEDYRGQVGTYVGYSPGLARLVQAGSDFFVMPSRSEPCGLTQLYAMRYGTPPIVRATGGLIDTVDRYNQETGDGTGFLFNDATPAALYNTVGWACSTYYDRPHHMRLLRRAGMSRDFTWRRNAELYVDAYHWAIQSRREGLSAGRTDAKSKAI